MNKFEELLEKYGKTVEDIEFEYSTMSDEELEAKFAELFDGEGDSGDGSSDSGSGETPASDPADGDDDGDGADPVDNDGEPVAEPANDDADVDPVATDDDVAIDGDDTSAKKKKVENSEIKFELSHDDIRAALYNLLDAYSEDGYCYAWIVEVYDEKFIYHDYAENKFYRQGYSRDNDDISLVDNKTEVFSEWLSKEEKDALDALKADYAALKSFKEQYDVAELKAAKDAILNSAEYAQIKESDEFKALVSDAENYSIDELKIKADLIFAASMKQKFSFETKQDVKSHSIMTVDLSAKPDKKKQAYGGLFAD